MKYYYDYWHDWNYLLRKTGTTSLNVNRADLNLYWNYYRFYFKNWKLSSDHLVQDLFLLLYKWTKPELKEAEKVKSERVKDLIQKMSKVIDKIGNENIEKIRQTTRLNSKATATFIEKFFENLGTNAEGLVNTAPGEIENAMEKALEEAEKILEEYQKYRNRLKEIFGGTEAGLMTFLNEQQIMKLIDNTNVKEILDLLDKHYGDEIFTSRKGLEVEGLSGIKFSNEIPPLPSEIVLEEILPDYITLKYTKNELANYEKQKLAEVPALVFIVDESGSMSGLKINMAKALFLKLASLCIKNRKPIIYIGFSDVAKTRMKIIDYSMIHRNNDFGDQFLDVLTAFMCGGTNFKSAIEEAHYQLSNTKLPEYEIVFITDGGDSGSSWNSTPECLMELKPLYLILLDDTYDELANGEHWVLKNMKNYVNNYIDAYNDLKKIFTTKI